MFVIVASAGQRLQDACVVEHGTVPVVVLYTNKHEMLWHKLRAMSNEVGQGWRGPRVAGV